MSYLVNPSIRRVVAGFGFFLVITIMPIFSAFSEYPTRNDPQMTVRVRLYQNGLVGEYAPLDELGKIIAQETSMGLILFSQIYREDLHQGVTVCFLVDPRMITSMGHRIRIVDRIAEIDPDHQFNQFEIQTPSDCWR
jgi:hypothetical protein